MMMMMKIMMMMMMMMMIMLSINPFPVISALMQPIAMRGSTVRIGDINCEEFPEWHAFNVT